MSPNMAARCHSTGSSPRLRRYAIAASRYRRASTTLKCVSPRPPGQGPPTPPATTSCVRWRATADGARSATSLGCEPIPGKLAEVEGARGRAEPEQLTSLGRRQRTFTAEEDDQGQADGVGEAAQRTRVGHLDRRGYLLRVMRHGDVESNLSKVVVNPRRGVAGVETPGSVEHHRRVTVRSIDHVQLAMPPGGEARAVAFYEGVLGIPQVPKPSHLAPRGRCWFEAGSASIHLGVDADFRPARKAHPALVVNSLAALVSALTAAGHPVTRDEPWLVSIVCTSTTPSATASSCSSPSPPRRRPAALCVRRAGP